jgi:hypothetical protein
MTTHDVLSLARGRPPSFTFRATCVRVQLLAWDAERNADAADAASGSLRPELLRLAAGAFRHRGAVASLPRAGLEGDDHGN